MRTSRGPVSGRPKIIFLAGAPKAADLLWDEASLIHPSPFSTSATPDEAVPESDLEERDRDDNGATPASARLATARPSWRQIPVRLPAELSTIATDHYEIEASIPLHEGRGPYVCDDPPSFLPIDLPENTPATRKRLDLDLLHHSFSFQTTMASFADETTLTAELEDTSLISNVPDITDPSTGAREGEQQATNKKAIVPRNLPITNISTLPIAAHLTVLSPQTIIVNLICGILSIPPLRTVTIRPRNAGNYHQQQTRTMDVQELLLGDDTAAGFCVTFWLQPVPESHERSNSISLGTEDSQASTQTSSSAATATEEVAEPLPQPGGKEQPPPPPDLSLRKQLSSLHIGDTLLLTNIALSAFRGKVQGQSISRRSRLGETRLVVLRPARPAAVNECWGSCVTALAWEKLSRVHEWVGRFVCGPMKRRAEGGDGAEGSGAGAKKVKGWKEMVKGEDAELPPDTPS